MTFLNTALLFGTAACLVPLIIHILNRSRFQTIDWGAMHLLESVIKVNHKRFQIEQLILLLIRCAIPVLLALCLARPVLTGAQVLRGEAPVSLVIMLDNSYSMDAQTPTGTLIDEAVAAAEAIIRSSSRGSEIAVIQMGSAPTPLFDQPVFDTEAVLRRLKHVDGGMGGCDIEASFDALAAVLAKMSHAQQEVVVISDFQSMDWQPILDNPEFIPSQMSSLPTQPAVTLLPVRTEVTSNVFVESLDYSQRPLGPGQTLLVRANLRNNGQQTYDAARVICRIDGQEHSVSQIQLPANGKTQALFVCEFEQAGSHVIDVEIQIDDVVTTDNRAQAAVDVWDSLPVLLVDGDPRSEPLQSETDYLAVALSPFTFGRLSLADLIETQTIRPRELNSETLQGIRVVVLANVAKLDDDQLSALADFVRDGGGLLVCPGNRIDLNWYNQKFFANSNGLLPAPFLAIQGVEDAGGPNTGSGSTTRLLTQRAAHPALEYFNRPGNGNLADVEIRRWYQVGEPAPDATAAVVMARLETGSPFLIERRMGEGVIVQMATSCDADWSDLPLRPVYVPLMQQLITNMAAGVPVPVNLRTGEPIIARFDLPADTPAKEHVELPSVSVVAPDGTRRTLPAMADGRFASVRYDRTQRPGVYRVSHPAQGSRSYVVRTDRQESEFTGLEAAEYESLIKTLSAIHVESAAEYLELDDLRRNGREVWKAMLAAVLMFLFLEVVLQQRFSRVHI